MVDNVNLPTPNQALEYEKGFREKSGLLDYSLPSIERLIEQGQPQFGIFAEVKKINYLDYHSHLISQKPVAQWRKKLKANQFAFMQIVHPPFRICLAIATIKLATTAFVYIYNEVTDELEVVEALQPLTRNTQFMGDHRNGEMTFEHDKLTIKMHFSPHLVSLSLHCDLFEVNSQLTRMPQPLAMCAPSGRRGWTFTQKEPFISTSGELILHRLSKYYSKADYSKGDDNDPTRLEFNSLTHANLDWTLGFMRHETNWFWSCINAQLKDERQFMLNLSMGVNETGTSENACWVDGQIYHLPPVMFRRLKPADSDDEVWVIANQNLGWSLIDIHLTFSPIRVYKKTDNYGVVASIFEQWIGHYSGHIKLGDESIVLDEVMGLAEDHYAKW